MTDIKYIKEILENHQHWIKKDIKGWEAMRADLSDADLRGADLRYADLRYADLRDADLRGADLRYADLRGSNLCDANLRGANLRGADLRYADLRGVKNAYVPITCPDTGSFIGWKKCLNDTIVKLEIPEDAQRLSAAGRKCRCDKALVLEIQNLDGTQYAGTCVSSCRDSNFIYEIGKTVEVVDFDIDRWNECSQGIHFFITRQEAVDYDI